MTIPFVFISYSAEDYQEKDQFLKHLRVLQGAGLIELWSDDKIDPGANQKDEKLKAIAQANIAILLITANFLNPGTFVSDKEISEILKKHSQGELIIIPTIVRACAWDQIEWLTNLSVRPSNGSPIWGNSKDDVDQKLTDITKEVAQISSDVIREEKIDKLDIETTINNLATVAIEGVIICSYGISTYSVCSE